MGKTQGILSRLPHFYLSEDTSSIFYQLLEVFGKTLDEVESDLLKVMYAHYVDKADNEGSQGFNTNQKGDLDQIFSLYLENLGGTSQLKQVDRPDGQKGLESDEIYRQRIRGLIGILKSGASTKQGIIDIVAANLGIVVDDKNPDEAEKAKAITARNQIRILEFLPQPQTTTRTVQPSREFLLENPNLVETRTEIRLRIITNNPSNSSLTLTNPRIVNLTTGEFAKYKGIVRNGDLLSFFPDETASLNGIPIKFEGTTPLLLPGESRWSFETETQQTSAFTIEIISTVSKLNPGSFVVQIPWDIEGFTDNINQFGDRPREQLKYIVDKVKAAGVFAAIAYEKSFKEEHELEDRFHGIIKQQPFVEEHDLEEGKFSIGGIHTPYTGGVAHEMSDALITSGVFDYTRFDSLNTFA